MINNPLLEIKDLNIRFQTRYGTVNVVDNINLNIGRGETLCIVGESGCGKSVLAVSVLGLLPENAVITGEINYCGKNIAGSTDKSYRGKEIAMIFEQPMSCLNPVMSVGAQIAEAIRVNSACTKKQAVEEAKSRLDEVGIPVKRFNEYPHQFSGGMQQRVMIAIALSCQPSLLIADEPTTSLDLTVQYQILELIDRIKERYKLSMIIITHDLGVVAEMADTVAVMYAGTLLEVSPVREFFKEPVHPYSKALMEVVSGYTFNPIGGCVPNLMEKIEGCPFHTRCSLCAECCVSIKPEPYYFNNRMEKCHFAKAHSSQPIDENIQPIRRTSVFIPEFANKSC